MGSTDEAFCLKWNDFQMSITSSFSGMRSDSDLLDVTVQCGSTPLQAHRLILSACSAWFREVFRALPSAIQNPVIVLWEATATDMRLLFDFMYNGEVNVKQENLNSFLALAERLQVRGLTQNETKTGPSGGGGTTSGKNSHDSVPSSGSGQRTAATFNKQFKSDPKLPVPPAPSTSLAQGVQQADRKRPRVEVDSDIQEVAVVKQEGEGAYSVSGQGQGEGAHHYQDQGQDSSQGGEMVTYDEEEMYDDTYYEGEDTTNRSQQDYGSQMVGLDSAKALARVHLQSPTTRGGVCGVCSKVIHSNLRRHIEDLHCPGEFPCPHCAKVYSSRNKLASHISQTCKNKKLVQPDMFCITPKD